MTLHQQIREKIEQLSHDELLRSMGYHNLKTGHRTLQKFLDTDTIYLWLKTGNFDMVHSSESFLVALIKAIGFPVTFAKDEIKEAKKRLDHIAEMKDEPYLFVDTHFKRKNEPVFVLAILEGRRHIYIDKELLVDKSIEETFEIIGEIIREHYRHYYG